MNWAPNGSTGSGTNYAPYSYIPSGVKNGVPYVYFDADTFTGTGYTFGSPMYWQMADWVPAPAHVGCAAVYFYDANQNSIPENNSLPNPGNENYANFDSVQVQCRGSTVCYGAPSNTVGKKLRLYPTGIYILNNNPITVYDTVNMADDDNVTNFCPKSRIGDMKP